MNGYTDLSALYDAPMDPASMDFTAKEKRAANCAGCMFERQKISVCNQVEAIAMREGMPKCDDFPVIYVLRQVDERQLRIDGVAQ